ncbi:protein lin-12-like [Antedon mediterranea]|uniref:protein lin-12-like n=1 Tax=Antedon mediterranea TaxID=105859 RepID=UPI003AF81B7E
MCFWLWPLSSSISYYFEAELCDVNRCQNGGTCYLVNGQTSVTTCACTGGYSGSSCDQLDICLSEPCQNGGTCTPVFNIFYSCGCQDGFSGVNCEIDEGPASCSDVVCQNGGECIEATFNSPLYCQCTPEFTGELCEERGNLCDVNKCQNGGTCYKISETWTTCSCVDGFTGPFCDQQNICLSEPCQNGGSCINTFNLFYSCKCQDGFTGINCEVGAEVPIDLDCSITECLNGGECIKPDDSGSLSYPDLWFCQCPVGFRGNFCEEQDELCGFNRCQNGGTCYLTEVSGVTTCACVEGFTGPSCEQNQKNCSIVGCLNKGSCIIDATDDWKCECPSYFSGEFCEEYDPCFFSPCLNGGRCSAFKGLPDCSCTEDFTGRFCEISSKADVTLLFQIKSLIIYVYLGSIKMVDI